MGKVMKILSITSVLVITLLVSITGLVFADDGTIDMVVSPNILNLESNGGSVHIHTDIGYVPAEDATLEVNGTEVEDLVTFVDSRGNLVVMCSIDTVKDIVVDDTSADFVLTCLYNDGVYTGYDSVPVICVIPQKV